MPKFPMERPAAREVDDYVIHFFKYTYIAELDKKNIFYIGKSYISMFVIKCHFILNSQIYITTFVHKISK